MPYISDEVLMASVAARMSSIVADAEEMGPHLAVLVTEANESAYHKIREIMTAKGYTAAQVDAWDARVSWSKRIGACHLFRALSANKPVQSYIDPNAGVCKAEKDLMEQDVPLLIDGVPADYSTGLPAAGMMTETDDDLAWKRVIRDERWGQ